MNSKAPIIAAWISIVVIIVSSVAYVVRLDARLDFMSQRIDKVINLCCGEVNKTLLKRPVDPHTFLGEFENASEKSEGRIQMGQQGESLPDKGPS